MSDLIKRTNKARRFPTNTCPASRHAARIGEALMRGKPYPMLTEEPDHCGESILSVVASLWEARTQIERLTASLKRANETAEHFERHWYLRGDEIERLTAERDELRRQLAEAELDARRIDWLETTINKLGEIHLHDGDHPHGVGIGLRPGWKDRTLREAIDAAMGGGND